MKKKLLGLIIIILLGILVLKGPGLIASDKTNDDSRSTAILPTNQSRLTPIPNDEHTRKIIRQSEIEREARRLEKEGRYEEAIARYREAADPSLLNFDYDAGVAIGGIERIYEKQGRYELALKELQWHLERNPSKYEDHRLRLEALVKSRDTGSPKPVHAHIRYLNNKYQKFLPPQGFNTYSDTLISTILRLYDTIGDLDGGMAYIDTCMEFFKQQDIKKYGKYRPGHADEEFLKVREAFEQDKAEGKKGRATRALIQSDYFPW